MARKKTKLYPTQIRYLEKNPIVSFHLKKEDKEKLKEIVSQSGKTVSQFVRECITKNIENESKSYDTGYEVGYDEGHKEGFEKGTADWQIYYFCAKCNQKMYIQPNTDVHIYVIQCMKNDRWEHETCP